MYIVVPSELSAACFTTPKPFDDTLHTPDEAGMCVVHVVLPVVTSVPVTAASPPPYGVVHDTSVLPVSSFT